MKTKVFSHNPLVAGIATIFFGSLLIYFKNDFINTILIIIGGLLIIFALTQFIKFLKNTNGLVNRWAYLPFSYLFTLIIGILLVASPTFWVSLTEIIIAVVVMLLAAGKIILIFQLRANGVKSSYLYFVIPSILLIVSIITLIHPEVVLGNITAAFGIILVLFGISEIADYYIIRNDRLSKRFGSMAIDVEEITDEAKREN